MPRLIWTPEALSDIKRLHAFIVGKNPEAARRAIAAIRQSVKVLANHPGLGRAGEAYPLEAREWSVAFGTGGYVVLYRFDADVVAILGVRHGREARD